MECGAREHVRHAQHVRRCPSAPKSASQRPSTQTNPPPSGRLTAHREQTLRERGQKREAQMHRLPSCLMDQMTSGSGLFPVSLESVLQRTGHGRNLALDMLTPRIYNLNVKIILDNSGSMGLDMMGEKNTSAARNRWIDSKCSYISVTNTR